MYASCQTSKYHHIVQRYYLPSWAVFECSPIDYTGVWKGWHRNGVLSYKGNFINGKEEGNSLFFHDDGKIDLSFNFKNGIKIGTQTTYYHNGNKHMEHIYDDSGHLLHYTNWWNNGNKSLVQDFSSKGEVLKTWYHNGDIREINNFVKGKYFMIKWNQDGTLNKKTYYDTKGKFLKRELFEKGKLVKTEVDE